MALTAVILDSSPLSLVTQRAGRSADGDACRTWIESLLAQGVRVCVPEVADYEVRRELIRAKKTSSVARLNRLKQLARYLPITTDVMLEAADLWAQARNASVATADIHALDGDVIIAAQALSLGLALSDFAIATSNVKHISRFAPADLWANIKPDSNEEQGRHVARMMLSQPCNCQSSRQYQDNGCSSCSQFTSSSLRENHGE